MKLGITMLIHNKDDIEFVTEFPCFLGHPVVGIHMFLLFDKLHFIFTHPWSSQPTGLNLRNFIPWHFHLTSFKHSLKYQKPTTGCKAITIENYSLRRVFSFFEEENGKL